MNFKASALTSDCGKYIIEKTGTGWIIIHNDYPSGYVQVLDRNNEWKLNAGMAMIFDHHAGAIKTLSEVLIPTIYTHDNTLTPGPSKLYALIKNNLKECAVDLGYPYFLYAGWVYCAKTGNTVCDVSSPNVKLKSEQ